MKGLGEDNALERIEKRHGEEVKLREESNMSKRDSEGHSYTWTE